MPAYRPSRERHAAAPRRTVSGRLVQVIKLALLGVALGAPMAFVLVRAIRSILFSTSLVGPFLVAGVVATLVGVAFAATYLPARRASRLSPVRALALE